MPSKKPKPPKPLPASQTLIGSYFQSTKEAPRAPETLKVSKQSIVSKKREPNRRKPLREINVNIPGIIPQQLDKKDIQKPERPRVLKESGGKSYLDEISELTPMQNSALNAVVTDGKNVFISGAGGTGKSHLLKKILHALKKKYKRQNQVGISASTHLAACNIGGSTIHRLLGIGIGNSDTDILFEQIKKKYPVHRRWKSLKVLVIDEISMLDASLFTKIDTLGKLIRSDDRPFGGIQIVCSGDFFQLSPVEMHKGFCFSSPSWAPTFDHSFILKTNHRQKDNQLIKSLNAIRTGCQTPTDEQYFRQLQRPLEYPQEEVQATELFPTKAQVKKANMEKLLPLPGRTYQFEAEDKFSYSHESSYFDGLLCEKNLDLKVGAQVMYLKTDHDHLVFNGSMGKIIAFASGKTFQKLKSKMHLVSKNGTLDSYAKSIEMDCNDPADFENFADTVKVKVGREPKEIADSVLYPIVWFKTSKGESILQVKPAEFAIDEAGCKKSITRKQLPLLLSWAISIHKAQGQSIERLKVDFERSFADGQVYVGLSRATNASSLQVCNFDSKKITVSKKVREFYATLEEDHQG